MMAAEGAKVPKGMWVTLPETPYPTAGPSLAGASLSMESATQAMLAAAPQVVGVTASARYPSSLKPAPRPLTEAIQSRLLHIVVGGEMELLDNIVKEQPELADSMYDYAATLAVQRNSVAMIKHILAVRSSLVARSDYSLLGAILQPLSPAEAPPSTTLDLLRAVMAGSGMPREIVHLVIRKNLHKSVLDAALECGADINAKDDNGVRPLFVALGTDKLPWVIYLLDKGARLDVHDSTPLRLNPLMKVLDRIKRTTNLKGWEGVMAAMVDKRPQVLTDTDALHANTLAHACRYSETGVMSMEYLIKAAETEQESNELTDSLQQLQVALYMGRKPVGNNDTHHYHPSRLTGLLDKVLYLFDRVAKAERPSIRTLALQKDIFGLTPLHYTVMGALREPDAATTLLKHLLKGDVPSDLMASALWWGNVDIAKASSNMSVHPRLDSEDGKRLISDVIQMKQQPPPVDQALPAALIGARDRMNAKLSEPPPPSPARAHPRPRDTHTHARSPGGGEEGGTATKSMGAGPSHERTQKRRGSRSRSSERKRERDKRRGKKRSRSRSRSRDRGGNGGGRGRGRDRSRSRSKGRSRSRSNSRSHSRSKGKRRLSVSHDSHTHTDARSDRGDGRRKRGDDRSRDRDRHDEDGWGGDRRRRGSMSASMSPSRRAGTNSAPTTAATAADIHPMYHDLLGPAADSTASSLRPTAAHHQQQPSAPDLITETLRIQLEEVMAKREEAKAERNRLQQEVNARQQSLSDRLKKMKDETTALAFKTQSIRDVTKDWEIATMEASEALERVQQACTEHDHELRRFNELIDTQSGTAHVQAILQDRKTEAASLQAQLKAMNEEVTSLRFSSERLEDMRSNDERCDFRPLEAANKEMKTKLSLLEADIAQLHRSIGAAETELAHVTQRADDAEAIARDALKGVEVEEWRLKVEVCNVKRTLRTVVTGLRIAEENENDARKEYVCQCELMDAEMAGLTGVLKRAEKEVPEVVQLNLRELQEEIVAVEKEINGLQNAQKRSEDAAHVSERRRGQCVEDAQRGKKGTERKLNTFRAQQLLDRFRRNEVERASRSEKGEFEGQSGGPS